MRYPPRVPPLRRPGSPAPLVALALLLPACERTLGEVELNWTVVDAAGRDVFPVGPFDDLCSFTGRTAADGERRPYRLGVRLRLCEPDCPQDCAAEPACQAATLDFTCNAARGYDTVPAREEPYDLAVELVADFGGGCACALGPACALVPGPRTRAIEPGLVTDLQVYLLVLTGLDLATDTAEAGRTVMDLVGCCDLDPSCA